jgi:hypothetical protein
MSDEQTRAIRRRLNEDLSRTAFERADRPTGEAAAAFFRDLFVELLGFDTVTTADGTWRDLSVDEWPAEARATAARVVAAAGPFRVVTVELASLTRAAERYAMRGLTRSEGTGEWATRGTVLTVFHAPDADGWHLVTPYDPGTADVTGGRPVLRRHTLGEGESHGTVAGSLASLDASEDRLADRVDEAFRVESVTRSFYEDYRRAHGTLEAELLGAGLAPEMADRDAHVTLTRLLCCYFLQEAGWFGEQEGFVRWFHERYEASDGTGSFHRTWLSALFFDGLNRPAGSPVDAALPDEVRREVADLPCVDGGLFEPTDADGRDVSLSDAALASVVHGFLERYEFTVVEERPYDVDVAVDPGMLGKLYESLVAARERDEAGIFYTPRVEVDAMCRLALYEQCREHATTLDVADERHLVEFVFDEPETWEPRDAEERAWLTETLDGLRVVDPACGSGAFLVGMGQVLAELYGKLGRRPDARLRRRILEENLHGVDVKRWAVRVAAFRLWLSLVEEADAMPTERAAEPELSVGLASGDSLLGEAGAGDEGFDWERAFPAVLREGSEGFDVVVGNPPYVRQEEIVDPAIDPERLAAMSADERREPGTTYKQRLREFVERRFGVEPYRTSDLYVYFYVRSVDLLREGGTLAFVTSNSWLDVDYGVRLQEFLLTETDLTYLFENRSRRTFAAAEVNTAVAVLNRASTGTLSGCTSFVAAGVEYGRFVTTGTMRSVLVGDDTEPTELSFRGETFELTDGKDWRSIAVPTAALWRLGGGSTAAGAGDDHATPRGRYRTGKWGKFTRAPTVFFELTGEADRELVPLGEECRVRRGTRTGANQFFYLPSKYYDARPDGETLVLTSTGAWPDDEYETELHIPREYWMHETEDGWVPNLVLKTSRAFETTAFDLDSLELGRGLRYLLLVDEPRSALSGDVLRYVEWGETYDPSRDSLGRKTSPFPASVSNRGVDWYDRSVDLQRGDVLPMKNVDTRHVYWFPEQRAWIDDRLHGIEVPGDELDRRFLAGVLNSTYGTLSCEVNGRVNLGQGALDVTANDHGLTLVPVLTAVEDGLKREIAAAFDELGGRAVTSVFDELGAKEPEAFEMDAVVDDRFELDRLVIRELLGFGAATHEAVYRGTLELVGQRIEKADSG